MSEAMGIGLGDATLAAVVAEDAEQAIHAEG